MDLRKEFEDVQGQYDSYEHFLEVKLAVVREDNERIAKRLYFLEKLYGGAIRQEEKRIAKKIRILGRKITINKIFHKQRRKAA